MAGKKHKKIITGVQFQERIVWIVMNNRKLEITSVNEKYFENNHLGKLFISKEAQGLTLQNINERVVSQIFIPFSNIKAIEYEQVIEKEE